jgi:EAL domain-containing protein (putative c-di-GMP-specific phosphodiesterase class I)
LLRWRHPDRGLVSPAEFIAVAEELGIIAELGEWALQEAARQMVDWRQRGIAVPRTAVNLSPRQFHDPDLGARLERILAAAGARSDWMELEITESAAMHDPERAVRYFTACANGAAGCARTISAPATHRSPCCAVCR